MTTFKLFHRNVHRQLTIGANGFKHENFTDVGHPLPDTVVFFKDLFQVINCVTSHSSGPKYTFKYNYSCELEFCSYESAEQARQMFQDVLDKRKNEVNFALGI